MSDPNDHHLIAALNSARAETYFLRIALQVFFINVVGNSGQPAAMLAEMKADVFHAMSKLPIEPQTAQGDQRMKEMTISHGEAFFAGLELLARTPDPKTGKRILN